MFEFENPYYFILLLLIPIGLVAQNKYVQWQTKNKQNLVTKMRFKNYL